MTIQIAHKRIVNKSHAHSRRLQNAWHGIQGLWKTKKIDVVGYQRRLRGDTDAKRTQ